MIIVRHRVNAASPRLSDEEPDLMEQEDSDSGGLHFDGWLPWTQDDLIDIRRVIESKMPDKQKEVLEAFLLGHTAEDLGVTEKYWRYHFKKAVDYIKQELGV